MSDHDHAEHGHEHHPEPLAPVEARVAAIESVLIEHGMFDAEMLDGIVENFEHNLGPLERREGRGARVDRSRLQGAPPRRRHRRDRGARVRRRGG